MKATAKPAAAVKTDTPSTPEVRVLKTGTCPTLSGKGKLTYNVGSAADGDIQFRIGANSGGGFFSDDWVPYSAIQQVFDKAPKDKPITSFVLQPLFRGKSANTPAFLFAALKNEGLVQGSKDKQRSYDICDPKGFIAGIKALKATGGDVRKPQAPEGKRPPIAPAKKTPSKSKQKKKG